MKSVKGSLGYLMVTLLVCAWSLTSGATHYLDIMTHDLLAQEAHLAEFGWEETVFEDGAIIMRQGQEDYLPFLVRTEEAYPFEYHDAYSYMPPPIVVRRTGLRVSVNGGGNSFLYWPPVQINTDDPGPPPALGPGIPDENRQMPEDVQKYWVQKEIHLFRNYDFETAIIKYYDCLKESSDLSGGEWTVLGPSPREQLYTAFDLHSKRWGAIPGPAMNPYHAPPTAEQFYEMAKDEYRDALANSSNTQVVIFVKPDRWSRGFDLTRQDSKEDFAVLISDLPRAEIQAMLPRFVDPNQVPVVHSCPALEARLERARQERAAFNLDEG